MPSLLSFESVTSGYDDAGDVLHGITLGVAEGEIVVVLGANGAGKTTLLQTIAGLLSLRSGRIWLQGSDVSRSNAKEMVRQGVTLVPQGRHLFGEMSVHENLLLGAYQHRDGIDERLEVVYRLFPALSDKRKKRASGLSGGEEQMVAVGRGMMSSPKVMLLDEPCIGVAPLLRREVYEAVRRECRESHLAVLGSEQEVRLALEFADRIAVMQGGRVVLQGEAKEFSVDDERLRAAYLGRAPQDLPTSGP